MNRPTPPFRGPLAVWWPALVVVLLSLASSAPSLAADEPRAGLATDAAEASPEESDEHADNPLVHTLHVPMPDGTYDVGEMLATLAESVGMDGQAIREHVTWRIDADSMLAELQFALVESTTGGAFRIERGDGELLITVDRVQLRRQEKAIRSDLRELVESWFPEAAALAAANYGVRTYLDGRWASADPMEPGGRVVLLIHGLDDGGEIWADTAPFLDDAGYTVRALIYPNDQPISISADFLRAELAGLREAGVTEVSLVGHSMGGLVARDMLTDPARELDGELPAINCLVMVGTPNHGSPLARLRTLGEIRDQLIRACSGEGMLFGAIFDGAGEAGVDLLPGSDFLVELNARPLPPGIAMTTIAGRSSPFGDDEIASLIDGLRRLLPDQSRQVIAEVESCLEDVAHGVGDGAVGLDATRIDGVDDHVVVDGNHMTMLKHWFDEPEPPAALPVILERLDRAWQATPERR